jgi:hypothetical protein
MVHADTLVALLSADPARWRILGLVQALGRPDAWVGAGVLRDAVWDHLHDRPPVPPRGDVDVVWFQRAAADAAEDRRLEARLRAQAPDIAWSVKNQARMHRRNADAPYASTLDALRHWPETATAIAARRRDDGTCEIAAPFGLADLFELRLRPTPRFEGEKRPVFLDRVAKKGWLRTWPGLRMV